MTITRLILATVLAAAVAASALPAAQSKPDDARPRGERRGTGGERRDAGGARRPLAPPEPLLPERYRTVRDPFDGPPAPPPSGDIDKAVFAHLEKLGIAPARLCSDAVFLRRAHLDVIGTLPTAAEAREFLADASPDKRAALIDRLLARDEFADYWAMRWSDVLRVKAEFPINLWPNAAQAYHRWIRTSMRDNMPYDRFAREMLTASGSNFRVAPVNFYRAMQNREPRGIAQTVALTFMGQRAEAWPEERLDGMAAFFARIGAKSTGEWKEEIIHFDPAREGPAEGVLPDGTRVRLTGERDPREVFADWLVSPKNPYFARAAANRAWAWLVGRGIVHESDDIRPDNPPSQPELLAVLEKQLVASGYDLKALMRSILVSNTYQLSCVPQSKDPRAEACFAFYPLRRLDAEVLVDALCRITGTTEKYSSAIPEPFTFVPEDQRSIALPDGSITSSFLELFGRPSRDTGVEAERNNKPTAAQRLHMLNSSHVQKKIEEGPGLRALLGSRSGRPGEGVVNLYLAILSRYPTPAELGIVAEFAKSGDGPPAREMVVDLAWALVNSPEFLYRH
jgi:hypothetical protein